MAVGVVVLASLLYAGAVQVGVRNSEIASFQVGQSAVRLVERLRAVSGALAAYRPGASAAANRAAVLGIRAGLALVDENARANELREAVPQAQITQLRRAWEAAPPGPAAAAALVRLTDETMRESFLRVGTIAVTRGSAVSADSALAEASLLALPVARTQFLRLGRLIADAGPGQDRPDRFGRSALTALYDLARSATNVTLGEPWVDQLPPAARAQAAIARAKTAAFLDLLHLHVARGDVFRSRSALLPAAAAASASFSALEGVLLPLLDSRLVDAQNRAQREIAVIIGMVAAIIAIDGLLSLHVFRSQLRSRRAWAAYQHQALHDALTGLPNRRAFTQAAAKAVAAWTPAKDRTSWIISIDLDYFKEVNDRYGHQTGDDFLVAASQRLHGATPPGDLVARLGGDEFAVLVHHDDPDPAHALRVGERICQAFAEPIRVEGIEHRLAASVGIVAVDALHATVDSVLRDADIAMYRAKEDGGDCVVVFDRELRAVIVDRAELAADLRAALAGDAGPRVVFQPILALDDRTCHGFEALARWRHPLRGELGAELLFEVAQEGRLVGPLGRHVVHEVCRHLAAWRDDGLVLETLSVYVNISPMEAAHTDTCASIADALQRWNIPPQTLVIELTETASSDSIDIAGRFLANLQALGVRVCLDDFGTGYSSLRHLNDFHVDAIKIDRSFVVAAANDATKVPVVAGIIALARGLNALVIAEGIETIEQRDLIEALGCRLVQGYLFARPLPPDEAIGFARRAAGVAASTT